MKKDRNMDRVLTYLWKVTEKESNGDSPMASFGDRRTSHIMGKEKIRTLRGHLDDGAIRQILTTRFLYQRTRKRVRRRKRRRKIGGREQRMRIHIRRNEVGRSLND